MAKVISFINMKGGVGKTTLAVNVAYTLSKKEGKKVLMIDMDPQMNATQYSLSDEQVEEIIGENKKSIYGVLSPEHETNVTSKEYNKDNIIDARFSVDGEFDIIPSHLEIMNINLAASPYKLRQYINNNFKDEYDVIIIDCPPTISEYTKIALLASDYYLVPMKTETLSFFGLPLLQNFIDNKINSEFEHNIDFMGIVINMARTDRKLYKKIKPEIVKKWKTKVFSNELSHREEIIKGLDPILNEGNKYILEMDSHISNQISNITTEMIIKGRI
jgi:chromosome partitioning protein